MDMAAVQKYPPSRGLADALFCYPFTSTLSEVLEYDDLISLHLTSKTLYRALHLKDFRGNSTATSDVTNAEGESSADKQNDTKDAYFQMLLDRAGRLQCEIPPPDASRGGTGSYSRPCSRKVKRCVRCRMGACRHARSFVGTTGNVHKACIDCLNYGTNPMLRWEDREASLNYIAHRKVDNDGNTIEIVPLKDRRLEHRDDLIQTVVSGSCHCLDKTENGNLKRWICWMCEEAERYESMIYSSWESSHQGLCECGCEVFQGILREGSTVPENLEALAQQEQLLPEDNREESDEAQAKSRTAANKSSSSRSRGNNSVAARVSAIEQAAAGSNDRNSNSSTSTISATNTTAAEVQQPEALPAALGLCAWCGLRVYGLHDLEKDGRPISSKVSRLNSSIPQYDTGSDVEQNDGDNAGDGN